MKKLIALLSVVALLACVGGLTAYAEKIVLDDANPTGTSGKDVLINVKDKNGDIISGGTEVGNTEKVYSVEVVWEDLIYVFKADQTADELVWDPDNHKYTNLTGSWEDDTQTVTVKNHSNESVDVEALFTNDTKTSDKLGVTSTIEDADTTLASAVGTAVADAPAVEYDITVSGVPTQLAPFEVDKVIITVSK